MSNNNNTYGQQMMPPRGMQQMQPQMQPQPTASTRKWKRRMMAEDAVRNAMNGGVILPTWLSQYSIFVYLLALAVVSFVYSAYSLPWYYMLSGIVAVLVFFLYGSKAVKKTSIIKERKEKVFERRIFIMAFIPRLLLMLLLYWIFQANYQDAFGFEAGDAKYYHDLGEFVAAQITEGNFHFMDEITQWNGGHEDISDMGYGIYLGFVYWLTENSMLIVRLLKCVLSSITVLLIYRMAKRDFGEQTGRIAAIFCALWPNFWYYCGTHLKEVEMVFLAVLFVNQADQMLRSRQFTAWKVIPILLIAAAMFTVRTPLGLVAILALLFSVVMSSSKVVTWGKRIIVGLLAILLVLVVAGNRLEEKSNELIKRVQSNEQQQNMEWRAKRKDGNEFAKYVGKSLFAPLIFTIPFPSMVRPFDGQDVVQIVNGGNFVKNILSFFTIFALFMLLFSGKWRDYMLPLSFMVGYLVVLVMSTFAQSERFHQPVMPLELMFAAYGLSMVVAKPKYKRWFMYWCGLMFVACIAWNWFKLAGRGLA